MLQGLNLNVPGQQPSDPPDRSPAKSNSCATSQPPNPELVKDVERRKDLILKSGQFPEWIFLGSVGNGILTFQPRPEMKSSLLLFTTPHAALDYLRMTKATAEVRQLRFDSLPARAVGWAAAGVDTFVLNRCPRCNAVNLIAMDVMKEKEKLLLTWAIRRAVQLQAGESKVREFLQYNGTSRPRARAALDQIRDHIDCGVPYLFELIAFLARRDQDEAAKTDALARLNEFGPQFADWESRWDTSAGASSPWIKAFSIAMVGLCMNFGMQLQPQPNAPQANLAPGDFCSFEFFIELKIKDAVHIGYPKICIRDTSAGVEHWASNLEWSWPDPAKRRVQWVDDDARGLTKRKLTKPEDAIGAEGRLGDMSLEFERILDFGKNQIVYALHCKEKNIRLAYGFDRGIFEQT